MKSDIESALNVFFVLGSKKEQFMALADMLNFDSREIVEKTCELLKF